MAQSIANQSADIELNSTKQRSKKQPDKKCQRCPTMIAGNKQNKYCKPCAGDVMVEAQRKANREKYQNRNK